MKAVNLIPVEQRERTSGYANRSGGVAYVLLGLLVCVALLALLYGVARHDAAGKEAEVAHYRSEAQRVQAQVTRLSPYKSFVSLREGREKNVRELVNSRFDWAHALSEFTRVLPLGVSISTLEGCVVQPSPSGGESSGCSGNSSSSASKSASAGGVSSATPAGSVPHFTLAGCALSQSLVSHVLTDLRLMDGAKEVELASAQKSSSSGGGSSSSGSCGAGDVSFSVKVTFEPLPTPPASAPAPPAQSQPASSTTPQQGATGKAAPASAASSSASKGAHASGTPRKHPISSTNRGRRVE